MDKSVNHLFEVIIRASKFSNKLRSLEMAEEQGVLDSHRAREISRIDRLEILKELEMALNYLKKDFNS